MTRRVPFMSLVPGADADDIRRGIDRVLASGWFILGPELEAFETEFAQASGSLHAVGVASGTDAIALALRAAGIGPGDEVVTSPLSAAFSALAIMMSGATPVFADIDADRLTLSPRAAAAAVTSRTKAILPVHLYGQATDMDGIMAVAHRHSLVVVEDACQAHLGTVGGRPVGTLGMAGAFSFYPTKNLGALGDGGAVITSDRSFADRIRRLRNGGQTQKYVHAEFGVNSRLDEMQAAILRARLTRLPEWTFRRRELAAIYRRSLSSAGIVVPPECDAGHVYHLFPVLAKNREAFQAHLQSHGVGTLVHYPVPLHRQTAFAGASNASCPVAVRAAAEVVSLPMHPALADADVAVVSEAVQRWRGCWRLLRSPHCRRWRLASSRDSFSFACPFCAAIFGRRFRPRNAGSGTS